MRTIMRDFCNSRYVTTVLNAVPFMGNLRRLAVCWLVLAGLQLAGAQDLEFGFAAGMGSENTEFSHGVAVDSTGNVYMGGYFRGRADFDPGTGTAFLTSAGNADAYLQKLDSSGNLVWVKTFSGPENIFGYAVMVDNQDNAYLAGSFSGSADFDPGAGVTQFTASGSDAFIVKLSSSGSLVWARKMGSADTEVALGLAVDSSRNVYATGYFGTTADFDPGAAVVNLVSAGAHDVFVQKLDSSGTFVWARGTGGSADDMGYGVAVDDAGNVYTAGSFEGSGDFNPGAGTTTLTSRGGSDVFVQKLSSTGVLSWAAGMGGTGDDAGSGIGVDKEGNPYTTGYFRATADFNPGVGASNTVSNGAQDAFVLRLSTGGVFAWVASMGGSSTDVGTAIDVSDNGDVYVTGSFSGSADFEPGTGTTTLASLGVTDVFAQRLDQNGGFVWAKSFGGSAGDEGMAIAIDASLVVHLAGTFKASVDFDPGAGSFSLASNGEADVFVEKFNSSGGFVWARGVGGVSSEAGRSVAADGSGNVYATGLFAGVIDFDPGAGVFDVTSAGREDAFVQKLDLDGNLEWALALGGLESDGGLGIAVDATGNVYLTGYFSGTMDLNPGAGVSSATAAGSSDAFVVKLNASGGFVWGYTLGATGADLGTSIAVDSAGAVLVTGTYNGTVDLDPGAATQSVTSKGLSDLFVQKLTSGKSLLWADGLGGVAIELATHIGVDASDNVYLAGSFQGGVDFEPGSGTTTLTSGGATDAYIVKLDENGIMAWARNMGSNLNEVAYGADVDGSGNVYVVGSFQGTPDFDPGAGVVSATSAGGSDIYLQKFDASGAFLWVRTMGGTATDTGYDVAVDAAGNPYTIGAFQSTASFDGGAEQRTSLGVSDIFLQSMDSSGGFNWVNAYGNGGVDEGRSIATSAADSVVTTGIFSITVDFDPGAGVVSLASAGNSTDIFVYQLEQDLVPTVTSIVPATTGPTNADAIGFTVTFSEPVLAFDALADLVLAHSGTAHTGASVSGGPVVYSVSVTGVSGNGSFTLAVSTATGIVDSSGNLLDSSITSNPVAIDNTAPTLSIGAPSASLTNDGPVTFPVTYSGANSVNLTSGAITLNTTGTATGTISVSNGTTSTPTVTISSITGNGTLGITIGTGTASDTAGNSASGAGPSATFTVDNTAPTLSIASASISLTRSGPVTYAVTYSGANSVNLTAGAITLNTTGTATGTVSVTNGTTSTPTVRISSITGTGTLRISIGAGTASDTAGNSAAGAGPSTTFTVDNTAPTLSIASPSVSLTKGGPVTYAVTYSGASSVNLTSGAITLNTTGTATGSVSVTNGTTSAPTVVISSITGNGTLGISIGTGTASDAAGNTAAGAGPSATFTVDNTAPTLSVGTPSVSLTKGGPVTYAVTYSGASSVNLTSGAVSLNMTGTATGTVSVSNGTASTPIVTISGITGNGSMGISIGGGTASDAAGNTAAGAGPSATFTVDNTAPTLSFGSPDASQTTGGPVSFLVTYAGADTVNLTSGAVTLNATGTATGMVSVTDGSSSTPTVTISNITGDGVLGISIEGGTATDTAGNDAPGAGPSATFAVDNNEPTLAIGAPDVSLTTVGPVSYIVTYDGADSINLTPDAITLNTTGTTTGSVSVTNGTTSTPTVTISDITGDGTVGISIDSGTAQDSVGNLVPAAGPAATFTVDNTAPVVAIAAPSTSLTASGPVDYSVTVSGADTVNLTVAAIALNATGTASASISIADGNTSTPTVTLDNVTGDGSLAIAIAGAIATDLAGNSSVAVGPGEAVAVDNSPPVLIIGAPTSALTSGGPVSFPLTYSGADTVALLPESISLNVTGSASGTVTAIDASSATPTVTIDAITGDGTLGISIAAGTALDGAGNLSDAAGPSVSFVVDNTAPTGTVDALVTKDGTPALSGTVDDSEATIFVGVGGETLFPVVNNGDSTWSLPDNTIDPVLADGLYSVSLALEDPAGNAVTVVASDVLSIDTLAPLVSVDALATSDTTPLLTGAVSDLNEITVEVSAGGQTLPAAVSNGTWSVQIAEPLADGTYDVTATATDAAGNAAADTSTDELLVSTASTLLGFDPLTTSDTTPQLQGTSEDALGVNAVEVTAGDDTYTATLGDGTWTVDISVPLAEGIYDVVLNALNSASTPSSATFSGALTIDATAPVVTVDTRVVNSATPGLSGSVEDSSEIVSISLTVNGVLYAPLVTGNAWVLEATDPLPDGIYDVAVSAVDAAGNAGVDITSDELTVDTQAPAPVGLILNDASPTREALIGFTLTFDEAVTGVDRGDFLLVVDGVPQEPSIPDSKVIGATPLSLDVAGEGMQYVLSVSTGTGDGSIAVLLENDGTILDHAGNALVAGLDSSEAYTLDRTPPQASISTTVISPTSQTAIPIVITFDESVTGFSLEDLTVENGVVADLQGDGLNYAATLVPASAGEVLVALLPGSVTDGLGNPVGEVQELSIQFSPGGEGEGEGEGETCVEQCAGEGVDGDGDGLSTCVEDCIGTSDATTDTDSDGIADSFELRYGLNPLFDDAADDVDFDDLSNLAEFLVNSDPTDANSPDSTLFVATDGNDETGNGTEAAPWRTISFALDQAALLGGDSTRIVVQTGTYVEDLLLEEGVSITGATDSDVVLQGTVVGAQRSALRSLTVIPAEGASHMLEMNDVAMLLLEVDFIGTPARDVTAILVDGNAVPLDSVIDACSFSSVGVGIDIGGEIPAIRRCTFGNIPAQFGEPASPGAGIIIRANNALDATIGTIGDQSDPENGWNDFLDTIEGFAVINERDESLIMQTNYWGVGEEGEVPARISGPAVFVPILSQSSAILAASLFCTVWDDTDQARIKSAGVMLTISPLNEVTNNIDGIYAFPAIGENQYTLTIRAPGYAEKSSTVEVRAGELLSLTIPMSAAAVEGEGEGEGEAGCNASKYLDGGASADSAASIFLIGLTVSILLGWGRIDRRI